ncbi:hypothetical protein BsWGS_07217 [Bradybaena similaris]
MGLYLVTFCDAPCRHDTPVLNVHIPLAPELREGNVSSASPHENVTMGLRWDTNLYSSLTLQPQTRLLEMWIYRRKSHILLGKKKTTKVVYEKLGMKRNNLE